MNLTKLFNCVLPQKSPFDKLPADDIIPLIFKYLSIQDLFNCRLVNKQFKYFSEHTDIFNRLFVGQLDYYAKDCNAEYHPTEYKYWDFNKKLIYKENVINFKCYEQFINLTLFNLDRNLKYLIIYGINDKEFNLENLTSSLINLECLEILNSIYQNSKNTTRPNRNQFVNSKNLKFLVFESIYFQLNLNAPKLEIIKIETLKTINIQSDVESIKHLSIDEYEDQMKLFKNLETIEFYWIKTNIPFEHFTKLKKIKIKVHDRDYSNIINNLLNILFNNLDRKIDIYFKDVKIENVNKLEEYRSCHTVLEYQIKNLNLLDSPLSTSILTHLNYNQLEQWFNNLKNDLPSFFFDRFNHLQIINIHSKVNNTNDLIWFINNLKQLRYLNVRDTTLDQSFYDNLPDKIKKLKIESNSSIDFNFIFKFRNLFRFYSFNDQDLFDLAIKSFSNLVNLKNFNFNLNGKEINICKFKKKFTIKIDSNMKKNELNFEQLKNYVIKLK